MPLKAITSAATTASDTTTHIKATLADKLANLSQMSTEDIIGEVVRWSISISLKILIAIAIYMLGRWAIRYVVHVIRKMMERRNVDLSLRAFVISLTKAILIIFLIAVIIGVLGLDTTSFVALFASAGLAFGMAMSGTLQNFAGGVMILILKPFRVGDFIEVQGELGTVKEILLFNTLINTPDNKAIMIPNGGISTGIINNYSHEDKRRVDWTFGIAYGDDYDKAKELLSFLLENDKRIHLDPHFFIALHSLGDSSVNIVVRAWVDTVDYWDVHFHLNEQVYKEFPIHGIHFPYPQMDVHIQSKNANSANS